MSERTMKQWWAERRDGGRRFLISVATMSLFWTVVHTVSLVATANGSMALGGHSLGSDFGEYYVAGRMALEGHAADVWNWELHWAAQKQFHDFPALGFNAFLYPPPFLLVASFLAMIPYVAAFLTFELFTLAMLALLSALVFPRKAIPLLLIASPVVDVCISQGHNGFLTAILLCGGLYLADRRAFAAGLMLGVLLYKPQFALVLAPVFLTLGAWRVIAGALVSAGLLVAATLALWGPSVWAAFFAVLPRARDFMLEYGAAGFHKIATPFAAIRLWGGSVAAAYAVQALVSLCAIVAACLVARRAQAPIRNATIVAATLVSTPYAFEYDFVALLFAIGWIWQDADETGWRRYEKAMLFFAWIAPAFGREIPRLTGVPINTIAVLLVLAIAVRRGLAARAPRPAATA